MKKFLAVGIVIAAFGILICAAAIFSPSGIVDFRGRVVAIDRTTSEEYVIFTVDGVDMMQHTVLADKDTVVLNGRSEDGDLYLGDIAVGDVIEGDYKTWAFEENYAKTIVVQKSETAK